METAGRPDDAQAGCDASILGGHVPHGAAAIIIELYRQGVHNFDQLKVLVFAARGQI